MPFNKSSIQQTLEGIPVSSDSLTIEELIKSKKKLAKLERIEDDNNTRHKLTNWIFGFTGFWIVSILAIVILKGAGVLMFYQSEIIALLTTTSANVLGYGYIVSNYIYKHPATKTKQKH